MFTDDEIWTPANVSTLKKLFVDSPILGNQTFYEKLHLQLKDAEPDVCRLAAEALWLLLLFVSKDSFGVESKVGRLREIWALSGEEFSETPALNEAATSDVVSRSGLAGRIGLLRPDRLLWAKASKRCKQPNPATPYTKHGLLYWETWGHSRSTLVF